MPDLIVTSDCPTWLQNQAGTSLATLISAASKLFQRRCGRELVLAVRTEIKNGNNKNRLWLKEPPITSVSSVQINNDVLDNSKGDAWSFDPATGQIWQGDGQSDVRFAYWWPKGLQNIMITYVGGYASIPEDIKEAVVETVKFFLDSRKAVGIYKSESIGSYSYTLNDFKGLALPPLAAAIADSYTLEIGG